MHSHHQPEDPDLMQEMIATGFEKRDVSINSIRNATFWFFTFATAMIVVSVPITCMLSPKGGITGLQETSGQQIRRLPEYPYPRLQTNMTATMDIADLRKSEERLLTGYTWADRATGKVRIPIEVAKEMLLSQGLPVRTAEAAAAASAGATGAASLPMGSAQSGMELPAGAGSVPGAPSNLRPQNPNMSGRANDGGGRPGRGTPRP